jgi:hypothetical protein
MFRLRHSDSICFKFCAEGSAPENMISSSSTVLPFGCGQIGLQKTRALSLTRQQGRGTNEPVTSCVGEGAIGREKLRLSEACRDSSIFDASVLMEGDFSRG